MSGPTYCSSLASRDRIRGVEEALVRDRNTAEMMIRLTFYLVSLLFLLNISSSSAFVNICRSTFIRTKYSPYFNKIFDAPVKLRSSRPQRKASTTGNEGPEEEPTTDKVLDEENSVPSPESIPQQITVTGQSNRNSGSSNPLIQGEVTMDGSLLVLVPAAVIAVLGFIVSLSIALNSQDEIVSSFEFKPRNEQSVPVDGCRGLCSSQEDDLNKLREFWKLNK